MAEFEEPDLLPEIDKGIAILREQMKMHEAGRAKNHGIWGDPQATWKNPVWCAIVLTPVAIALLTGSDIRRGFIRNLSLLALHLTRVAHRHRRRDRFVLGRDVAANRHRHRVDCGGCLDHRGMHHRKCHQEQPRMFIIAFGGVDCRFRFVGPFEDYASTYIDEKPADRAGAVAA
jgi:hypothetical protein